MRLPHTGTVPSFITQRWKPGNRRLYEFMRCFPLTAWPQGAGLPRFMFSWYVSGELAAEKVMGNKGERTMGAF